MGSRYELYGSMIKLEDKGVSNVVNLFNKSDTKKYSKNKVNRNVIRGLRRKIF